MTDSLYDGPLPEETPESPEEREARHEQDKAGFQLAAELESFARSYSPDYAMEMDDGCYAVSGSDDRGCKLFTETYFSAERTRDILPSGMQGEVAETRYVIGGTIKLSEIPFAVLTPKIKDMLVELGESTDEDEEDEYTRADLESGKLEIGLQYMHQYEIQVTHKRDPDGSQNHIPTTEIFSTHQVIHEPTLKLWLDDVQIAIPPYPEVDEKVAGKPDETKLPQPAGAVPEAPMVDAELADVIVMEDFLAFSSLAQQLVVAHELLLKGYEHTPLEHFYDQIERLQTTSEQDHINRARNLARQLFLGDMEEAI